jgi:hypothetical protein
VIAAIAVMGKTQPQISQMSADQENPEQLAVSN